MTILGAVVRMGGPAYTEGGLPFPHLREFPKDYAFPLHLRGKTRIVERDVWDLQRLELTRDWRTVRAFARTSPETYSRIVELVRRSSKRLPAGGARFDMVGPLRAGLSDEGWLAAAVAQGEAYLARMTAIFETELTLDERTCLEIRSWENEVELLLLASSAIEVPEGGVNAVPWLPPGPLR